MAKFNFEIEFQVPGEVERYINFDLIVFGGWTQQEIGGGQMGSCLDWDWDFSAQDHSVDDQKEILIWITNSERKIREMFETKLRKHQD
jgi:hypothetical protein